MTDRNDDARLSLVLVAVALVTVGATAAAVAPDLGIDGPALVEPPAANGSDDGGNATGDVDPDAASERERVEPDRDGVRSPRDDRERDVRLLRRGARGTLEGDRIRGDVSVGPVADEFEVGDDATIEGDVSVAGVREDGELEIGDDAAIGGDLRVGAVDGELDLGDDAAVGGDLVVERVGPDGEFELEDDATVRGDLIVGAVVDGAEIDVDEDAVDGAIVVDGRG